MSTATINRHQELIDKLPPASTLILHDIDWEEYEELRNARGEAKGLRISFDQGTPDQDAIYAARKIHPAYRQPGQHV